MIAIESLEDRRLMSASPAPGAGAPPNLAGVYASNFKQTFGVPVGVAASSVAQAAPGAMSDFALSLAGGGKNAGK